MKKKIVIIGAGSAIFTQGLVADLIKKPGSFKWHLSLVDIDPVVLESMAKLCKKMIDAKKADIELDYSTERREVLSGADYVVCTIAVGGRRAWEQDVFIPRKYGVFQPVGDSVMPGGISRAMRMIPAMVDIAKDVKELCPDAHFFNYSNPMTTICKGVRKATDSPIIGLCHGVIGTQRGLASFLGLDPHKFTSLAVGLNHLTFMYDIRYEGRDIRNALREKYEKIEEEGIDYSMVGKMYDETGKYIESLAYMPFSWSFFKKYNVFPAPGDRHIVEFFAERFNNEYYGKKLGIDAYSLEQVIADGDKIYENVIKHAQSDDPLPSNFFDKFEGEHEQLIDIIHSIENDEKKVFSVNMPNNGVLPNLPYDSILEMPAAATASGMVQLKVNNFPEIFEKFLLKHIAIADLTVEAALTGDKRYFVEAVLMGGYLTNEKEVEKMVDELIEAQKQYLPQF
ncbi:MAG TPA: hypothetical protein GXX14_05045 [Clostridiaceae bacterium]|nr:hypothetical protein [Clostridiaceae bacterium]